MDTTELRQVRRNLDRFLKRFDDCIATGPSRRHLRTYVGGQIGDLPRKNAEAMALEAGVAPRTLVEFLGWHRWEEEQVRRRVQEIVIRDHGDEEATGVIDETGMPKKGDKTVGVDRQYCGASGKIDNCVVTVNLGYVTEDFHAVIDTELYLPKESWGQDQIRRREAGIPETLQYRPKWKIALEQLERARDNGVPLHYVTADETYGACAEFRDGAAGLGLIYMVEVPRSTWGWTRRPHVVEPAPSAGQGRPRTRPHLAAGSPTARRVDRLWRRGGPHWEMFHIKDTEKGPVVWEVRATRFWVSQESLPGPAGWLVVARNVLDGEVKYFLSNAPEDFPLEKLLAIAFSRWHIERLFQDAKGEIGLDQFQVHQYLPVRRHLILSMVSLLFLMKETTRLREKKPLVERAPGPRGRGSPTGPGPAAERTHPTFEEADGVAALSSDGAPQSLSNPSSQTTSSTPPEGHLHLTVAEVLPCFVAE